MLVGTGFNEHPVFEADVGRQQHLLAAVHGVGKVVKPSRRARMARMVGRHGQVVGLGIDRKPHGHWVVGARQDGFGESPAQALQLKVAEGAHVAGQQVQVVDAAHVHAAPRKLAGRVLQGRGIERAGPVLVRLEVHLAQVPVGGMKLIGGAVAQVPIVPANSLAGSLQRHHAPGQGLGAAGPPGKVPHARRRVGREFEGVMLVIVIGPQVHGVALGRTNGHAHDVNEKAGTSFQCGS